MKKLKYKPQENSTNEVFFANKEELIREVQESDYIFVRPKDCKEIYLLSVNGGGFFKLNYVDYDAKTITCNAMDFEYVVNSYDLISINDEELGTMLFN